MEIKMGWKMAIAICLEVMEHGDSAEAKAEARAELLSMGDHLDSLNVTIGGMYSAETRAIVEAKVASNSEGGAA